MANKIKEIKPSKHLRREIGKSEAIIGLLADAFNNSPTTIKRWVKNGDIRLLNLVALRIYQEELGINQSQAIEQ